MNTKELKNKIRGVASTQKLASAMGLVASSKIRRAKDTMLKSKEYFSALDKIITFLSVKSSDKSIWFNSNEAAPRKIIVVSGDRGLAGGYNSNVFNLMSDIPADEIIPIGKKGVEKFDLPGYFAEPFTYNQSCELADKLCAQLEQGKISTLGIVYTEYASPISSIAKYKELLPLKYTSQEKINFEFEPSYHIVLKTAVREYISALIYYYVKQSLACEYFARRAAMDNAKRNADIMIDELTLKYNRARQSAITNEISEIVATGG